MTSTVEHRAIAPRYVRIGLPIPPSLNNCFPTSKSGHRYPSPEYEAWRTEAGHKLNVQRPHKFTTPCQVTLTFQEPKRAWDIDNRIKPTLDLLVKHSIIPADDSRFVRRVIAQFGEVAGLVVEIEPA